MRTVAAATVRFETTPAPHRRKERAKPKDMLVLTSDAKHKDHNPGNKSQSQRICDSTLLAIMGANASKLKPGVSAAMRR